MSTITVLKSGKKEEFPCIPGKSLLEILRANGYAISAPCGGHHRCGKCTVQLTQGGTTACVTACSTFPEGDCLVTLGQEHDDLSWNDTASPAGFSAGGGALGAAVDLGTTTVAVKLYALDSGACLGSAYRWNEQRSCGADVISRIDYCLQNHDGLARLSAILRAQVKDMLNALCAESGADYHRLREIFAAGNTVMQHLFAGLSPAGIAAAPFTPLTLFDGDETAVLDGVPVRFAPCVAGYVGGDITAGLLAAKLYEKKGKALFIDIGTNGEMALGGADGFTTCAVASGPAFEGAEITCGMPAATGAVSRVTLTDEGLDYQVLGGGEAVGLCGSGLLDLVACLLELGYIDESGCLAEEENGEAVFHLTPRVYLTQRDVRQLQLAKAAVAAGIRLLLQGQRCTLDELDALYLSGGFGNRLRGESAVRIGMLPGVLPGKIVPLGNACLAGAAQALRSPSARRTLHAIQEKCRYMELSVHPAFNDCFVAQMCFPEVEA